MPRKRCVENIRAFECLIAEQLHVPVVDMVYVHRCVQRGWEPGERLRGDGDLVPGFGGEKLALSLSGTPVEG